MSCCLWTKNCGLKKTKIMRFLLILGIVLLLVIAYFFPFGNSNIEVKEELRNEVLETKLQENHLQEKEEVKNESPDFIAKTIIQNENAFDIIIVDLRKVNLSFYFKNSQGRRFRSLQKLRNALRNKGQNLIFATNGGIFTPQINPEGLYIENGNNVSDLNLKQGKGNFYMQPNGVFYIKNNKSTGIMNSQTFVNIKGTIWQALQSGPLLLQNGVINSKFSPNSKSKFIRNGVGIIDTNTVAFAISDKPVNFYSFAHFFKTKLKCSEALYLDGHISKMYIPDIKRYELGGSFATMIGITK